MTEEVRSRSGLRFIPLTVPSKHFTANGHLFDDPEVIMNSLRNFLFLTTLLAATLAAHATTIEGTYSFSNAVLQDNSGKQASITGTIDFTFNTVSPSLDTVNATNFTVSANGTTYVFGSSTVASYFILGPGANSRIIELRNTPSPNDVYYLELELPIFASNPMPFTVNGGTLCPVGGGCYDPFFSPTTNFYDTVSGDTYNDISGTLQLAAATPEPSSLILLGTGIVSALGLAHRRLRSV